MGFIENDVKDWTEAKAATEAAKKLPVGFIANDVMKAHETTTPPTTPPETKKEEIKVGFIAEDVMKQHAHH